jgi:hypothetical protein
MREELAKAPHAISRAKDDEDRLRIWNRAHYLGLGSRLPGNWMPDGSLNERSGP